MHGLRAPDLQAAPAAAGPTPMPAPRARNVQTAALMNRLHDLDAALAACQRQAIGVEELCKVWNLHCKGLDRIDGSDREWADALLRKVAMRHGILGLVQLRPPPANGDGSDA